MTAKRRDDPEAIARLAGSIVDDLLSESDVEIAADVLEEGFTPALEVQAARALIELAIRKSGKAKLASAKKAVAAVRHPNRVVNKVTDIADARRKLVVILANNPGLSLAARKEAEMSDNDVLGMLDDLQELGVDIGVGGSEQS
jgi:hypothetical protein